MTDPRVRQLKNLLDRGRALHYDNVVKLSRARFSRVSASPTMSAASRLVYTAMQVLFAFTFMEERGYLPTREHDAFTDALFAQLAGPDPDRLLGLVQTYAQVAADPKALVATVCPDLCVSLVGEARPEDVQVLAATPRAVLKLTRFYTAQVFGDQEMLKLYG